MEVMKYREINQKSTRSNERQTVQYGEVLAVRLFLQANALQLIDTFLEQT